MFRYTTGDLLLSEASALVNTVNCEGFMGKGIAYQFKLMFPENNADYIKACKNGSLTIGSLHVYEEKGKTIINFPTKNKWREKSKIEYIQVGLNELISVIKKRSVDSIAIPPLGSGNGGLIWHDVKKVIEEKLSPISDYVEIYIFEPSMQYSSKPSVEPKLGASALILLDIKRKLKKFNKLRLQTTAYFTNLFANAEYFDFRKHRLGPYDHSIDIVSKNIREYQVFHGINATEDVMQILYNRIISEAVEKILSQLRSPIEKACEFVNSIDSDHELECLSIICFLMEKSNGLTEEHITQGLKTWSEDKASRFTDIEILSGINSLCEAGIVEKTLIGYALATY